MTTQPKSTHLIPPVGADDHTQGAVSAAVTLVQYGDYECPYSGQAYWFVRDLQARLGDRLRYVFRNFPLTHVHPHAQDAAEVAGPTALPSPAPDNSNDREQGR